MSAICDAVSSSPAYPLANLQKVLSGAAFATWRGLIRKEPHGSYSSVSPVVPGSVTAVMRSESHSVKQVGDVRVWSTVVTGKPADIVNFVGQLLRTIGRQGGNHGHLDNGEYCTLTVRSGNCLSEIAKISNTSVEVLLRVNKLKDAELLQVGQALLIPRSSSSSSSGKRASGGPESGCNGKAKGPKVRKLIWQQRKSGAGGGRQRGYRIFAQRERIQPGGRWVLANWGDSLWSLADEYRVSVDEIRAANGLSKSSTQLNFGQELLIPVPPAVNLAKQREARRLCLNSGRPHIWAPLARLEEEWRRVDDDVVLPCQFAFRQEGVRRAWAVERLPKGLKERIPVWRAEAFGLPVKGGWLSSFYGWKDRRWYFHHGIDIAVEEGTPVVAATSGRVTFANWKGGYGKTIQMDHGNGFATLYAHNDELLVEVGQTVRKGRPIALSGNTGYSTGPHLHFEIHKDGRTLDPIGRIPDIE
eukprot:TRINITY_DN231_c0_g1_i1.p1 TRINITY_DN231_c0_g1~~TRINITY_DN231_c0_g1_i1.p1  ORF type:complete len:472 (-),score=84.89 TRINITY_DN231_c0_g1_i1:366-1781(-)